MTSPICTLATLPTVALRPPALESRTVAPPTPSQLAWRGRIESGLRVAAPFLDLLLAAGDRVSRAVDRGGLETPPPPRRVESTGPRARVGAGSDAVHGTD
jgi:hypothetical protein